jgi:hypothetical protein
VAVDGPKNDGEDAERCAEVRSFIDKSIDWDCEVHKRYNEINLGCRTGPKSAIDWFFKKESEGIILEDDCLPGSSFFPYCEELLTRYRDDERIMTIAGYSIAGADEINIRESYSFIKFPITWGWATWRRAWRLYDMRMTTWPDFCSRRLLYSVFRSSRSINYWQNIFDQMYREPDPSTWDYQWTYACFAHSGLCVFPERSMIRNIGFGMDATHCKQANGLYGAVESHDVSFPLLHPDYVICNEEINGIVERKTFLKQSLPFRATRRIGSFLKAR